jgi:hypothetical protein
LSWVSSQRGGDGHQRHWTSSQTDAEAAGTTTNAFLLLQNAPSDKKPMLKAFFKKKLSEFMILFFLSSANGQEEPFSPFVGPFKMFEIYKKV